jgi:hypothetical protein
MAKFILLLFCLLSCSLAFGVERVEIYGVDSSVGVGANANGGLNTSGIGKDSVGIARIEYPTTAVTSSAYVNLIAALTSDVNEIILDHSSGATLILAVGATGVEINKLYIPPFGSGSVDLRIPSGSRVSVKAVSTSATTGALNATFLK